MRQNVSPFRHFGFPPPCMKIPRVLLVVPALFGSFFGTAPLPGMPMWVPASQVVRAEVEPGQIITNVGRLLEQAHYSRKRLNDDLSKQILATYLDLLDYNRLFFNGSDVERFRARWGESMDDEMVLGRLDGAKEIYEVFRKRFDERITLAKRILDEKLEFTGDGTVELNRQKAAWPEDDAAAERLWRDRITGEVLLEKLNRNARVKGASKSDGKEEKKPDQEAKASGTGEATDPLAGALKTIRKRYDQLARNINEQGSDEVLKFFLQAVALTYDPHSEYLNKADLETFTINMRLSLVGIGAVLRSEDGYAKIMELVPGGPASKDGRIKVGDRVVAVAQGEEDFVECVDLKLDKVVGMIRGKKDTVVRIRIMPANSDSELRVVEIIRDEVKLKDSEAKGELIEWGKPGEAPRKLGIVILPSFYGDMDRNGNPNAKSTTRDVLAIVDRMKTEGAEGIVMDLRRNGGGFLDEAVNLTGLFIKKGPVVQVKSYNGEMNVLKDRNSDIAYDGPLVVLVNRGSASASEIFAGAMQDYRRAVVVGDSHTFGKGTVQQMVELSRVMPFSQNAADAGAVKLTIQKFYRAAGGSTQLMGVESDIVIPSLSDQKQNGEDSLKGPLEYDVVPAQEFDVWSRALHVDDLKKLSSERIGKSAEFGFVREDLERIKTRIEENTRSLNEAKRKSELDEDKTRRSKRLALRDANTDSKIGKTFKLTLDTIKEDVLPLWTPDENSRAALMDMEDEDEDEVVKKEKEAAKAKKNVPPYDPVKEEALSILSDLIRLDVTGETVQFKRK